jgi:hypothetical protein
VLISPDANVFIKAELKLLTSKTFKIANSGLSSKSLKEPVLAMSFKCG